MHIENLVVGKSLSSFAFAYYNNFKLVTTKLSTPKVFHNISIHKPIANLVGAQLSSKLWSHILVDMSLCGNIIGGTGDKRVNIFDKEIKLLLDAQTHKQITYDTCYLFDTDHTSFEAELHHRGPQMFTVYDWVDVRSGTKHKFDVLETGDNFLTKAYFYQSPRVDGSSDRKDAVCVSTLTEEQIKDFNYSDTMIKFKLEHLMSSAGIVGTVSGRSRARIRLEPNYREIERIENAFYADKDNLKFLLNKTTQEVLDEHRGL